MKKITIISGLFLATILANSASAQGAEPKAHEEKVVEQAPAYIMDVKKLMTCFKDGQIPDTFPKYDESKTKDENKEIVSQWCYISSNYATLSDVGIEKLKGYRAKQSNR